VPINAGKFQDFLPSFFYMPPVHHPLYGCLVSALREITVIEQDTENIIGYVE
jgi:hypothetical protein